MARNKIAKAKAVKRKVSKVRNSQKVKNTVPVGGPGIGGGINPQFFFGNQAPWYSKQITQPTTEFINLRWYLITNLRQLLSEMYVELGLVKNLCIIPVQDALRGGIEIKSKQIDEDQIEELIDSMDRDSDLNIIGEAEVWNRLYGGGGVLILTDQDPSTPFDINAIDINSPLQFRAVDMWELFYSKVNTEGYDPSFEDEGIETYNYYGVEVHKSRVIRLKGMAVPSYIRPRLRGWGVSVVETLINSLNQYLKATNVVFEILDEFKVDVYKIKGLATALMAPDGGNKVRERISLANEQKNYQNSVTMDSEDDWDHKQLSFAGMAETMEGIRMQVASDMRMPMLKLFGTPARGLNASDEGSLEVYNSMVESEVRDKIKYAILRVCKIKCQQLFGIIPDDLSIKFKPLRVLSAEQEENVKTQKFTRLQLAKALGEISSEEFRDACNRGDLFDITLDTTVTTLGGMMDEATEDGILNPPTDDGEEGEGGQDKKQPIGTQIAGMPKQQKVQNASEVGITTLTAVAKQGLWSKAKKACMEEYGLIKWAVVTSIYKKLGGNFKRSA